MFTLFIARHPHAALPARTINIHELGQIGDHSDATCSGSSRNALEIFRMLWTI